MQKPRYIIISTFIVVLALQQSAYAADAGQEHCKYKFNNEAKKYRITKINISPQPIFDESASDSIALHRWANALHIVTKPFVIEERLPIESGDVLIQQDIREAEAILRAQRYLADAEIQINAQCVNECTDESCLDTDILDASLDVITYDNWTLLPSLSFSRSGGENTTIVGVREDNLLGLGIRSTLRYRKDEQRSGYQLGFVSAFPWLEHSTLALAFEDNDDGELVAFTLDKPFYHFNTQNSFLLRFASNEKEEDIFQNSIVRNTLVIDSQEAQLGYGIRLTSSERITQRLLFGLNFEKTDFDISIDSPSFDMRFLAQNRDFTYPWIAYEYFERDIQVKQDIYLIKQPEDINLGLHFYAQIGLEPIAHDKFASHFQLRLNKGFEISGGLFLLSGSSLGFINASIDDHLRLDAKAEYFYRVSKLIAYYARTNFTFSNRALLDRPIVIDDDNGVRAYPNQYQHGARRISASIEARFYTDYNFYQLFDLGFAAFLDVGRAYGGETAILNEQASVLASAGLGARLYSNKASSSGVLHFDIAFPLAKSNNTNDVEWSVQFRRGF